MTGAVTETHIYDGDGNRVKATVNDVATQRASFPAANAAGQTNTYQVTYDTRTGQIAVWRAGGYLGSWTDTTPLTSGGYISLRTDNSDVSFDGLNVLSVVKYYYSGGQRIALRRDGIVSYLLTDQLGSTRVTTGETGAWAAEMKYYPFGGTRYNSSGQKTTYRFTGQRFGPGGGGLYDYGARWYDSTIGRFIQADTIVPQPGNPQDLNRYSYCRNNPLRFIDPSGYDPLDQAWRDEFRKVHGRDPTAEDMQIRLFSIAFPDEWDWGAFYTPDGALRPGARTKIFREYPAGRDWASMPTATGRLAGWYTDAETEAFVRDIGSLFAGLLTRFEEANGWGAVLGGWVRTGAFVGGNGLAYAFRGDDETGNVHHWAWSLNLGYIQGEAVGRAANEVREFDDSGRNWQRFSTDPNHRADVALGNIGVAMGAYMSNGIWPSRAPGALRSAWSRMPLTVRAQ